MDYRGVSPVKKRGVLTINGEKSINFLMVCLIGYYPILYSVNEIVNRFISYGAQWDSALCLGLLLFAILLAIPVILKRQSLWTLVIYIFFAFCFAYVVFFNMPGKEAALEARWPFFGMTLSYFCVGCAIRDFKGLETMMVKSTKVVIWATVIWAVIVYSNSSELAWQNNMRFSYYFLPSAMFAIYYAVKTKFKQYRLYFVLSLLVVVVMGTRGPIVLSLVFVAYSLFYMNGSKRKNAFWIIFVGIVALFIATNFTTILEWLNEVFLKYKIQNAAIHKMLYADDVTNGRSDLYASAMQAIQTSLLAGQGVFADRGFVGTYAHFLPIELCLNFGVVFGIFFLLFLAYFIVHCFLKAPKNSMKFYMVAMGAFVGVFKLLFSGSYLEEPYFYLFLGLVVNIIMTKPISDESECD